MMRSIIASLLVVSSAYAQFEINVPATGEQSTSLNGSTFDNCVQITPFFNFHWTIMGNDLIAVHEGSSDEADVYFAWAVVADQNAPNRMAGSDAIITSFDNNGIAVAEDYLMTAVAPCNIDTGVGVCPDSISGVGMMNAQEVLNTVTMVAGFRQDGIHVVRYTRPLIASDATDLPVDTTVDINYIFARGPIAGGLPSVHVGGTRTAVSIDLGRTPSFDCTQLAPQVATTTTLAPLTTTEPTTAPTTILLPESTVDSGASTANPEYVLAALVMGAALL